MRKVYLDNAATTPVFKEVIESMSASMRENYGNPSSTHHFGRTAKSLIETCRKNIAKNLNANASEIIFTSGGTEANNLILRNAVAHLGVSKIITSKLEHHAVLKTVNELHTDYGVEVVFVEESNAGVVDIVSLRSLLGTENKKTLVSLMFVNNEIGTILEIKKIASICKEYNAFFHSDSVQAVGHFDIDLSDLNVDFISASAHKFHGPKGIGFAYFKKGFGVKPMIFGGEQEKGIRAGTEAVHSILGMDTALKTCLDNLESDVFYILSIKKQCIRMIREQLPQICFNAGSNNLETSTVTILNMRLPNEQKFLLFNLDMKGIAVSGGSACQSGSNKGSHVLETLLNPEHVAHTSLRVSFSKFTEIEDVEFFVESLKELLV
jgi:cysteine desulfurase